MPQVVAAAVTTAITAGVTYTAGTAAAWASFSVATTFATTLALTSAAAALAPKPKLPSAPNASQTVTLRQSNVSRKLVYGNTRVGGNTVFIETTNDDQYLHLVIVMAAHEIQSFDTIYLDDEALTLSGADVVNPSKFASKVKVYPVTVGSQANIPASLISETSWTSSHRLEGQAYLYVRLEFDADVFTKIPNISAEVSGRKVYDTTSSSTIHSSNPAMIIRDYLLDDNYGLGATSAELNEATFITAARICDETVSLGEFSSEKRYELDGVVDTANTPRGNIEQLLTSLNGSLFYSNGSWSLRAGAYSTPSVTLDEDDLAGGIVIATAVSGRDSFNAIKGQFISPSTSYQATDFPEITSSTFESEDGTERRYINLDLPFTSSSSRAQRIAKQILYKNRQKVSINASFKLSAFKFEVGDTVRITNSRMGFNEKVFEVVSWRLNFSANEVSVDCNLAETNAAVYAWDYTEETAFQQDNTTLPSGLNPPSPTNLALTSTAVVNDDGITIPAITATWDVVNAGFVQYYEIQYKRLGGEEDFGSITVSHTDTEDFGSVATTATSTEDYGLTSETILSPDNQYQSVVGTTNSFTIIPVLNNYDYNVRVRSINAFGARSDFVSSTLASAGDTTPPSVPSGFSIVALYKSFEISWVNPPDQDLDYIEIWENNSDNLSTANLIGTSASTNFLRANIANNTQRYYWIRAVDLSLNKSDYTSSVNATTLLIEPNDFNDAVNDLFQEAGAFGIEPVSNLPTSGAFDGQMVLLKTNLNLYRWDATTSAWSTELYTASSLTAGSITLPNFASGIEPIGIVGTLPNVSGYTGAQVVFLTTDNKLYRYTGTAWTSATNTQDLEGELGEGLFPDDFRPIERVSSLPTTNLTQGRVVMLTTDNKLYRYTGNAWTSDIAATDITGQVAGGQIADGAITTTKITDDAITAPLVAANAISADKISTNAVTTSKIEAGSVIADKIAGNAITAGKIAADAVEAGTIAAGAINASSLFVDGVIQSGAIATDAIVADKIFTGSVVSSKIAGGAVTADKISVSELSAISADLGTIQVDTANITDGAITNAKIDTLSASKITSGTIDASNITVTNLDAANITNGTIGGVYLPDLSKPSIEFTQIFNGQSDYDRILPVGTVFYFQENAPAYLDPLGSARMNVYTVTNAGNLTPILSITNTGNTVYNMWENSAPKVFEVTVAGTFNFSLLGSDEAEWKTVFKVRIN